MQEILKYTLTLDTMSQVTQEAVTATMITADIHVTCALAVCAILSPLRSRNTDWKRSVSTSDLIQS